MKIRIMTLGLASLILASIGFIGCSSDDDMGGENNPGGSGTESPSGTVPENTDSGKNNNTEPDSNSTGDTPTWQLVFEDNFEGPDSIPDISKWSLTEKGTSVWDRHMSESYGQAYQKDGYLYLFGMQSDGEYLTGGIESKGKFDFTYGQLKCRARFLRHPHGNHTGIWMMPEPPAERWPRSGEIDIMEHLNDEDMVYETVHNWWSDGLGHKDDPKDFNVMHIDPEDFNTYGLIWDEDSLTFTVNGEINFVYKNEKKEGENGFYQWPFYKPFYIILSQSLGGEGTWEGVIDDSGLPSIFQIDWVKVWQKTE